MERLNLSMDRFKKKPEKVLSERATLLKEFLERLNEGRWKSCCVNEIKRIWKEHGGPMNIVHYVGECPECKHYIGLTQTSEEEAKDFVKYPPLTPARLGAMLRFIKTKDLHAFLADCKYASNFSKYFWYCYKVAKESKNN